MASTVESLWPTVPRATSAAGPRDVLDSFTGPERVLGIIPFVADVSTVPRWHHLLFTEDKILAVPAFPEPAGDAGGLFLAPPAPLAARYPSVRAALGLAAIPQPLSLAHVSAVIPYREVRLARLSRDRGAQVLPELEFRGRRTSWWFLRTEDDRADHEKTFYARDLILALLPFRLELVGFSEVPRPAEWYFRHGGREPLPLLGPAPEWEGAPRERHR